MRITAGLAFVCTIALLATPAFATSITNQDTKEHTIIVDHGAKESQQKIAAGGTAQVDCSEKCGLTVEGSGYGREPTNDDKLIIDKQGMLHFASEKMPKGAAN